MVPHRLPRCKSERLLPLHSRFRCAPLCSRAGLLCLTLSMQNAPHVSTVSGSIHAQSITLDVSCKQFAFCFICLWSLALQTTSIAALSAITITGFVNIALTVRFQLPVP